LAIRPCRQAATGKIVEAVILRLVGALMLEANDAWAVARRYMSLETLAQVTNTENVRPPAVAA
jgi:putative transposase